MMVVVAGWALHPAHGQDRTEVTRPEVRVDTAGAASMGRSGMTGRGLQRVRRRIAQIRGGPMRGPVVVPILIPRSAVSEAPASASGADQQVGRPAPSNAPSSVATRADLNRMEVRILRRIETLIDELYRNRGSASSAAPDVILRPEPPSSPQTEPQQPEAPLPSRADSLRTIPADSLASSVEPLSPPSVEPPTVVEVRRAFLETGLFRALEVNFETESAALLPRAERSLTAVGEVLARYPAVRVEVAGHTDATGSDAFNQRLSEQRAQSVRQYLMDAFSIAPDRLVARGYGEARPIASNNTPSGRALNRRVEFRVLNPEAAERALESGSSASPSAEQWEKAIRDAIREALQQPAPADTSEQQ